ncbi:MAG: hypothetical protein CVV27_06005 [Candidatus Melainabacteria bacterium HGW-Melainabacteria-1]|nr:MAG: hypothetical protein CVV27_06005 [Candidatus Melainabacteria bacterium HGW-Melainabacteria-1]
MFTPIDRFRFTSSLLLALLLLAACDSEGPQVLTPEPVATPAAVVSSSPLPEATPLPEPAFSQTPAAFRDIRSWNGHLSASLNHRHSAQGYAYQEQYSASGSLSMRDESDTAGAFLTWPLPSGAENWQTVATASSELDDRNSGVPIQRICGYSGSLDMDVSLKITGGRYRLAGRLKGVSASCSGSPPEQQWLPQLALTETRRYWEITDNLPISGTLLSGNRQLAIDGKVVSFTWELNPGK